MDLYLILLLVLLWLAWHNRKLLEGVIQQAKLPPIVAASLLLFCSVASAQEVKGAYSMNLSPETRSYFRNVPDEKGSGSCVQASIGIAGTWCNDLNAASLLWDTEYGPAVRGGSWPSRVEDYCNRRGIKAWSVTGKNCKETLPWIQWAAKTGRFAAIGFGQGHFQTLYGYNEQKRLYYVVDNNTPHRIDQYTEQQFCQMHSASEPWVVILEKPSSPPPEFYAWWK